MKKLFVLFAVLLVSALMLAKQLGPDVAVYKGEKLQWEEGARSYFVMFKSLLENRDTAGDAAGNPQADHCMDEAAGATYTLTLDHVPQDAYIDRAFLIWTGAVPQTDLDKTLDNEVTLKFTASDGGYTVSKDVVVPAKTLKSANDFTFESYRFPDDPNQAYFTYRTDITDFFKEIHEEGVKHGNDAFGMQLLGDYNLSNLTCADDAVYVNKSVMVSGWAIILIYTSEEISPKKMYIYNGLAGYFHEQSSLTVSGFEFPDDPVIRLTFNVYEGDPGRATLTDPDGNPAVAEGLRVQGDAGADNWLSLTNACNPEVTYQEPTGMLPYVEVYNSVSSVYGHNVDDEPVCVGGTPPAYDNTMEYGVDMDTFVLDTTKDDAYAVHFYRGGTHINMQIGANQDWVLTNFLVVSVDTRAANFDIPGEPEKYVCTHLPKDQDYWCANDEKIWYAIKVQNWGDDTTSGIIVRDRLVPELKYVPGTTSYAIKFDDNWQVADGDWHSVPDNGGFPLESGIRIPEMKTMEPCNKDETWKMGDPITPKVCPDTILIRFQVQLNNVIKNAIVTNSADIQATAMPEPYKSNTGIPVRLKDVSLAADKTCQSKIDMTLCGGEAKPQSTCEKDDECAIGQKCDKDSKRCVDDPDVTQSKDIAVSVSEGKNSPYSGAGSIVVHPSETNLVMGQIAIKQEISKKHYYSLDRMAISFKRKSDKIELANIRLIDDKGQDGKYDTDDPIIASSEMKTNIVDFVIDGGYRLSTESNHSLLIVADVSYVSDPVKPNETYRAWIEKASTITFSDAGKPTVVLKDKDDQKVSKIEFASFMPEPSNGLIITQGPHIPVVPEPDAINGTNPMMHIRVKSNGSDDKIKNIKFDIPSASMKQFGDGITALFVYLDANGDGQTKGDKQIAKVTNFPVASSVDVPMSVELPADKDVYLLVSATLNLGSGDSVQLRIKDGAVKVNNSAIYKLPLYSKEFINRSDVVDSNSDDDGCSALLVSDRQPTLLFAVFAFLSFLSFLVFVRRYRVDK